MVLAPVIYTKSKNSSNRCKFEYKTKSEISDHVKDTHVHQCQHCFKKIHSKKALKKHNITCNGTGVPLFNSYECLVCCCYTFQNKEQLENHYQDCHAKVLEGTTLKCPFCDFVTTTRWLWQNHKKQAHPKSTTAVCDLCKLDCKTSWNLKKHLEGFHEKEKNYLCEQCDFRCKNLLSLKRHKKRMHEKELNHFCDICGKGFYARWLLNEHINNNHSVATEFKCLKCDKVFKYKHHMKSHNVYAHQKYVICTRCEKMFTGYHILRNHLKNDWGVVLSHE